MLKHLENMTRLLTIIIFLVVTSTTRAESAIDRATKEVLDKLSKINPESRPSENGHETTIVLTNMMMRGMTLDDVKMEATYDVTFRMSWNDTRLSYSTPGVHYVTLKKVELAWLPDVFFKNGEVSGFESIYPDHHLRVSKDGFIHYSARKKIKARCPMDLKLFPYDSQECLIMLASYSYTIDDIVFLWIESDPVQVTRNLHLPLFNFRGFTTDYCNSKTNTGTYSCLMAKFVFKRATSWYISMWYIPTAMFVIMAFLSLIVPSERFTERLALCLVPLMILPALNYAINTQTVQVSYTRSVDIYSGTSVTFIFAILVHNIVWQIIYSRASSGKKNVDERYTESDDVKGSLLSRIVQEIKNNKSIWTSSVLVVCYILFLSLYFSTYSGGDHDGHESGNYVRVS